MVGEYNVNNSQNNESMHNDFMENDDLDADHAHVQEEINIESNAREILNSVNMNTNGQPHDNNVLHMARTPLYPDARCSILQAEVSLLNLKVLHGCTSNSLTGLL